MKTWMKNITFSQQWWFAFAVVFICEGLAYYFKLGVLANLGWVLSGLTFVLHPVCPKAWQWRYGNDEKRMQRDFRIGGAVVVLLGLLTRFGV